MKNPFEKAKKSAKEPEKQVIVAEPEKLEVNQHAGKTEAAIIAEIHDEFDMVEDRLLQQAKDLLETIKIKEETNEEKIAERLKKIGFVNVPIVKKAIEIKTQRDEANRIVVKTKSQADLIMHYKQNYPLLKFITQDELERICKKYTLNYAPVRTYIMDIPEKNLLEIESAKPLMEGDAVLKSIYISVKKFGKNMPEEGKRLLSNKLLFESWTGVFPTDDRSIGKALVNFLNGTKKLKEELFYRWDMSLFELFEVEEVNKSELFIAAPPTHFALEGLKKEGEFGYVDVKKMVVKHDPIVLRYVRGGIQVLSKWGLEASEPALINEINN